jgi:nucleotide-binding universal stress UspA family protein
VAESVIEHALAEVRTVAPEVRTHGDALLGHAGATLVAASSAGGTIVLGNRGRGGFSSLLLGSVSQHVAVHAACSVVVVRGRGDTATGPIVVGADDSNAGRHAIRAAFEEAAARGAGILAARVFTSHTTMWGPEVADHAAEEEEEHRTAELAALTADVTPWKEKFPDVDVECVALEGHPGSVLVGLSASAQLVVVGTRGRGGFAGLLLGSVSQQLLHHAESPVLIAREFVDP